jgi:hypothetical protein
MMKSVRVKRGYEIDLTVDCGQLGIDTEDGVAIAAAESEVVSSDRSA